MLSRCFTVSFARGCRLRRHAMDDGFAEDEFALGPCDEDEADFGHFSPRLRNSDIAAPKLSSAGRAQKLRVETGRLLDTLIARLSPAEAQGLQRRITQVLRHRIGDRIVAATPHLHAGADAAASDADTATVATEGATKPGTPTATVPASPAPKQPASRDAAKLLAKVASSALVRLDAVAVAFGVELERSGVAAPWNDLRRAVGGGSARWNMLQCVLQAVDSADVGADATADEPDIHAAITRRLVLSWLGAGGGGGGGGAAAELEVGRALHDAGLLPDAVPPPSVSVALADAAAESLRRALGAEDEIDDAAAASRPTNASWNAARLSKVQRVHRIVWRVDARGVAVAAMCLAFLEAGAAADDPDNAPAASAGLLGYLPAGFVEKEESERGPMVHNAFIALTQVLLVNSFLSFGLLKAAWHVCRHLRRDGDYQELPDELRCAECGYASAYRRRWLHHGATTRHRLEPPSNRKRRRRDETASSALAAGGEAAARADKPVVVVSGGDPWPIVITETVLLPVECLPECVAMVINSSATPQVPPAVADAAAAVAAADFWDVPGWGGAECTLDVPDSGDDGDASPPDGAFVHDVLRSAKECLAVHRILLPKGEPVPE